MTIDFIKLAKQHKRLIVLPESDDDRILEAAVFADSNQVANIILLGEPDTIKTQLAKLQLSIGSIQIVNPLDNVLSENNSRSENKSISANFAEILYQLRASKGLKKEQAESLRKQPLYFANLMVKEGLADACVAGANSATADVIRAALQVIGTKTPEARLSSFFIMLCKTLPTPVLFTDCAINILPDAKQLADIACQSGLNIQSLLGITPKIAMLSCSTNGSAKHENIEKVIEATKILHDKHPELNVIGDIQFDAALSNRILQKKWGSSNFEAPANVFVFPSLNAGNIGYKIAERIGGATAIGPILQGLAKPVNDLSRGADVESIINTIAVTCLQVD